MTEARVEALVAFTEEVRRLGSHVAQRQEQYAAAADSLERLRHRRGVPSESEAALPPAARAPPSSALMHAAYQVRPPQALPNWDMRGSSVPPLAGAPASRGKHGGEEKAAAEPRAEAAEESDAESEQDRQLAKILEEARLLRTTRSPAKMDTASARPEARAGAADPATGMAAKAKTVASAPYCSQQAKSHQAPAVHLAGSRVGSSVNATVEKDLGLEVLGASQNDALERILQQAREIAPLNDMGESISGYAKVQPARGSVAHSAQHPNPKVARGTPAKTAIPSPAGAGPSSRLGRTPRAAPKEEKRDCRSLSREPAGTPSALGVVGEGGRAGGLRGGRETDRQRQRQ